MNTPQRQSLQQTQPDPSHASVFSAYWKSRGIAPNVISCKLVNDYAEYYTQMNGKMARFQWTKMVDHITTNKYTGISTQHQAFSRLNFSKQTAEDVPLFVSPLFDYSAHDTAYLVEGLPDAYSLLTAGLPTIAVKAKGALSRAENALIAFCAKYPNIKKLSVIPDPDGWESWSQSLVLWSLPIELTFFDIRLAFQHAQVKGKDVNDLWKVLHSAERFLQALSPGKCQINRPLPQDVQEALPRITYHQESSDSLQEIIQEIEGKASGDMLVKYAVSFAPCPSQGTLPVGDEIEIRGNGGFYVKPSTKEWRIYGQNAGGVGLITLASYLMGGQNSLQGHEFSRMLHTVADFVGVQLKYGYSQNDRHTSEDTSIKSPCPSYFPESTVETQDGLVSLKYYECSEFGNKERFLDQFDAVLRYNNTQKRWAVYDGMRWILDEKELASEMAERLMLSLKHDANFVKKQLEAAYTHETGQQYVKPSSRDKRTSITIKQSSALKAMTEQIDPIIDYVSQVQGYTRKLRENHNSTNTLILKNAKSSPRVTTIQPEYDSDPFLLNTQNGTLDLQNGTFKAHTPNDLLSKVLGTHFEKTATCPEFEHGLQLMFDGDEEMIDYILRLIAFSLPGNSDEKVLPFCYGPEGDNAKSTFMLLLKMLLNDYYGEIPIDALMSSKPNASAPDENLANLQGKRFVMAPESNSFRLNSSKVKLLTGGDTITARVLHGHNMTFLPSHTLWIVGNKKPQIDADDPAIWIRLKLIEFAVIPKAKQKRRAEVLDAYRKELPGILNKILAAGRKAKEKGLTSQHAPRQVNEATEDYRHDSDNLGEWITEHCLVWEKVAEAMQTRNPSATSDDLKELSTALARSFKMWCRDNDEPFHKNQFYEAMQKRGFRRETGTDNKLFFYGIQLKTAFDV